MADSRLSEKDLLVAFNDYKYDKFGPFDSTNISDPSFNGKLSTFFCDTRTAYNEQRIIS